MGTKSDMYKMWVCAAFLFLCLHIFSFWCTTVTEWIHVSFYWNICSAHFFLSPQRIGISLTFFSIVIICCGVGRGFLILFFVFSSSFFSKIHHFYYATENLTKNSDTKNISFTIRIVLCVSVTKKDTQLKTSNNNKAISSTSSGSKYYAIVLNSLLVCIS